MHLRHTDPIDFRGLFSWLAARAIAGIEVVSDDAYERDGITVALVAKGLELSDPAHEIAARRLFDLDADPTAIRALLQRDSLLAPLLRERPGVRVPGAWDPFELVVRAIVGQQVSVAGARTILGRIAARYGFSPDVLAEVTLEGMPRRRAETVRNLAQAVADGSLVLERRSSLDETVKMLTSYAGVGPWTAHYIAMRALGEADAFPAGDLILRRRAGNVSERELMKRAESWRPYRAYGAMLLWMSA